MACLTNTKARCLHPVVWYPEDELPIILDKSYQDWQTSAFYVRDASEVEEEYAHNELVNMACEAAEFQPVIKPQRARKPTIRAVQKMTVEEARRACDGCCMEGDKAKKDLDALSKKVEKGTLAAKGKNAESKATSKADAAVLKNLTSENSNLKKEVAKLQEELKSAEISSMASEKALNLLTKIHSMQPPRQRESDSQYRSNSGSEFSRGGDRNRHDKSQRRDHDPADRAERTPRRISPRRSPPTRALQGPLLLTANARNCQRDANQSTIKTVHVNVKTYGNQKDGRKRISITTNVTSTMSTITVAVNVGASTTTTANTRTTANNFIY